MKNFIKKTIRKLGYDLIRFNPSESKNALLSTILNKNKIDLLLDVGANAGHYGISIRKIGYKGKIISFEPIQSAFEELEANAKKYKNWETNNCALGSINDKININISLNSLSSSIFDIHKNHLSADPMSSYVSKEEVELKRLDSIITLKDIKSYNAIMLKIDVQGFELEVLSGAESILSEIKLLQLEMSFKKLYEGAPLYEEITKKMQFYGFDLFNIIPEFIDTETGELLQADGIFIRKNLIIKL